MSSIYLPPDISTYILDSLPAKIVIISPEGQILYRNNAWDSFGDFPLQTFEELLSLNHPSEVQAAREAWNRAISSQEPYDQANRLKNSSGSYIWHLEKFVPIKGNWLVTYIDVHELKSKEVIRRNFISGYSHDLRTPLTSAKLKAQLAAKQSDNVKIQDIAQQISKDMDRADKLIRDMLDTDLWETGRQISLHCTHFDMSEQINNLVSEYRMIYKDRFVFNQVAECNGWWDVDALKRIMDNLISNAMKYSERGTPIEISVRKKEFHVSIAINNKGQPIPKDIIPTLFFAYERGQLRQTSEGWGLGLSVVIELCHSLGGVVDVESSLEAGTTFTVVLPLDSRPKLHSLV